MAKARDAIRQYRKGGAYGPGEPVTVWLAGGDYFLAAPLGLSAADSGAAAAPVAYRAIEGQTPRLVGATRIKPADFEPVTDPATLARVSEPVRGRIVELDLKTLGVKHAKPYPDLFGDSGGTVDLFFGGRRMPLARYPKEGFMTMKRVVDTGGTFEYREPFFSEHERWQKVLDHGVWLKGYWRVMWENEALRVQSIDTARHTVTFAKPAPGGIGSKYHRPEGNGQEQYWLLNLLEEVARPGEWAIDFNDQKLYFYPPAGLDGAEILLADNDEPVVLVRGASHIVLRGLLVEGGLGHGILVQGGEGNLVAGCTVRNVDRYGVVLDGGRGHTVQSCDLCELGAGGVWLGGGDENASPRIPAGHRAVNNHIHHFARIERVYAPGVNCGFTGGGGGGHHTAVGMLVAHNLIHDTPHAGVLFGSWDSTFEYNEVFRYCTVSDDMGAFYCYEQYARGGNTTLRYNLMHSTDRGDGIYFDHDHRDAHVYGNIACLKSDQKRGYGFLYKIGSQAKDPQTIDCHDNVAALCNTGYVFVAADPAMCRIENNVAVSCRKTPWKYARVKEGKEVPDAAGYGSGKNISYDADPGFAEMGRLDFRLKPDSRLLRELPDFKLPPVDKIGLYRDEYRRKLPGEDEIDRFGKHVAREASGYEIEDRR